MLDTNRSELVKRAWNRSTTYGVDPVVAKDAVLEHREYLRRREYLENFISDIYPYLTTVSRWLQNTQSVLSLASPDGLILEHVGEAPFLDGSQQAHIGRGAIWSEQVRGTNSIGTSIAEQKALAIVGTDHYLEENQMMYCISSPIFNSRGDLFAVLNLGGPVKMYAAELLPSIDTAARSIEDWLLIHRSDYQGVLSLYPEKIGDHQALLSVDREGFIVGTNRAARELLPIDKYSLGNIHVSDVALETGSTANVKVGLGNISVNTKYNKSQGWLASLITDLRAYYVSPPTRLTKQSIQHKKPSGHYTFDHLHGTDEEFLNIHLKSSKFLLKSGKWVVE
ncbi:hypothetical protein JI721_10305 [Alicyclobacillus cycloheptanicus]|uniref:Transcriptional regulator of acetoin/glycerol metabolism n=1 Tax=Alicyclobacillus cycloheptanicus TaxID=1457 RepID=A0ABT9XMD6_9BACL|nr:hypothetical protein [Alicyclobacillus cycloheptanicus]MDQ0191481.1 transcriptional regulator of acetoin/glycerol metabolism [Alicyclobacillus cycloheptanicus]WDM00141.1 hypothetical protein JI721_10305 [Alicyclobacillus cycloheptanicus]